MQSLYNYIEQNIQSARFILLGDFNLPDIDWQSMKFHSACSDVLIDTMLRFNLHQVVNQPTRVQGETSNILDLIFLSNHFPADETKIEVMDGISDHKLTLCTVPFRDKIEPTNIKITYPDFKYADDTSILNYLIIKFPSFEELSNDSSTTIEILWSQLKEIMHHCINTFVPLRVKKIKKHNPWITREVIHAKRKVKRIRKRMKRKPGAVTVNNLTAAVSDLKTKIKTAKSNYFTKTLPNFLKNSPSKFWSYLKPAKNNKSNTPPEKDNPITADKMNNYFKSVFTVDDGNIPDIDTSAEGTLESIIVNEAGVINLLLNLDTKKRSRA